ncbi:MAG: recombinase family protein [Butyricicoccus sp.]
MSAPRVGLYLRLSREDADGRESQSIETQRLLLTQFVAAHGWQTAETYIDDGWSGVRFDRPAFQRLLRDIESSRIDTVITKDLSRLGRNYARVGELLEEYFPAHGVRYLAVSEGYDSGAPGGVEDYAPFLSVFHDMYARDISKKVRAALGARRQEGKFIGAQPPFGYRRDPTDKNKLLPDPDTAPDVQRMFALYLACGSVSATARALTAQGVPTPSQRRGTVRGGREWSTQTVRRMLENPTYAGHLTQGRVRTLSYKVRRRVTLPREDWAVIEGTHPPLIDAQTFERVQALLRTRSYRPAASTPHLLTGLAFCADCGAPMAHVRDGTRVYLVCSGYRKGRGCTAHRVREDAVLGAAADCLRRLAADIELDENRLFSMLSAGEKQQKQAFLHAQARADAYARAAVKLTAEGEEILAKQAQELWRQAQTQANTLKKVEEALPREQLRVRAAEILRFDSLCRADLTLLLERVKVAEGRGVEFVFRFRRPETEKDTDA